MSFHNQNPSYSFCFVSWIWSSQRGFLTTHSMHFNLLFFFSCTVCRNYATYTVVLAVIQILFKALQFPFLHCCFYEEKKSYLLHIMGFFYITVSARDAFSLLLSFVYQSTSLFILAFFCLCCHSSRISFSLNLVTLFGEGQHLTLKHVLSTNAQQSWDLVVWVIFLSQKRELSKNLILW